MLVCPNCRSENLEDASVCRHCGNGLEAVSSPMRRIERSEEEEEPQLDLMPARATSAWPIVIVGLVAGLALLGWGLSSALRPNPCAGRYSSVLFAYCTEIPTGWAGGSDFEPGGNLDRYQRVTLATEPAPGEESPPPPEPGIEAETTVEVNQILDPNISTPQYAQQFRTSQEADGLEPGPVESVIIDGQEALAWDFSRPSDVGDSTVHYRDVIFVRSDGAWQIRFISTDVAYTDARIGFEELLAAWRWKA